MKDLLPAYAAGSLSGPDRDRVGAHLADCPHCRADLASWQAVAAAAVPAGTPPDPASLVRTVLSRSTIEHTVGRPPRRVRHLVALVAAEARLIRPAAPIASALVMALGAGLVLLRTTAGADLMLSLIAPIVAAAGVAGTYRSRRDPAAELLDATPTSGRLLLLIRTALVFGYDLVLALSASAVLTATGAAGADGLNELVGAWLGPMALLSSFSLLIAVFLGPDAALGTAVGLWAVRVLAGGVLVPDEWPALSIMEIWSTNAPVLWASTALAIVAVAMSGRGEPHGGGRATQPM
jgi:putative zinc finger protein